MDGEPHIIADVRRRHCDHVNRALAPPKLVATGPANCFTQTVCLWVKIPADQRSRGRGETQTGLAVFAVAGMFCHRNNNCRGKNCSAQWQVRGSIIASRNVDLGTKLSGMCIVYNYWLESVRNHSFHGYSANPPKVSKCDVLLSFVSGRKWISF